MDAIYKNTTNSTAVTANTIIPLTIARKHGCIIADFPNGASLTKTGYYKITGTITFTVPTAGTVTVIAQKNGTAIPGITASASVATATTEINSLVIDGIVRVWCGEGQAVITLFNDEVDITLLNATLTITYLG